TEQREGFEWACAQPVVERHKSGVRRQSHLIPPFASQRNGAPACLVRDSKRQSVGHPAYYGTTRSHALTLVPRGNDDGRAGDSSPRQANEKNDSLLPQACAQPEAERTNQEKKEGKSSNLTLRKNVKGKRCLNAHRPQSPRAHGAEPIVRSIYP